MGVSIQNEVGIRLVGLGNEILADDAFGILVAREVQGALSGKIEVVCSSSSGFHLMDDLLGASRLIVVDAIQTPGAAPGTMRLMGERQFTTVARTSPHFAGLFEVLAVARYLGLPVPHQVTILAVEASDCETFGGAMHPAVRAAIPAALELVRHHLAVD